MRVEEVVVNELGKCSGIVGYFRDLFEVSSKDISW